jgi:hypothetical protein
MPPRRHCRRVAARYADAAPASLPAILIIAMPFRCRHAMLMLRYFSSTPPASAMLPRPDPFRYFILADICHV